MNHLLLIDGRNLVWRTADAFSELSAELEGETVLTGAIYGFFNVLMQIRERWSGKIVVVAWEGSKNFRRELYPAYKERPIATEEQEAFFDAVNWQEDQIVDLLRLAGIKQFKGVGCEADDVLGTLAERFARPGLEIVIYSGDADIRQLSQPGVLVVASHRSKGRAAGDVAYTPEVVEEKHGVPPLLLPDLKALMGDPSDNIPGVKGIGKKTAALLIQTYGSVEAVIDAAKAATQVVEAPIGSGWPIKNNRLADKVVDAEGDVRVFKVLTTIKRDARIAAIPPRRNRVALENCFRQFGCKSLLVPFKIAAMMKMGGGL